MGRKPNPIIGEYFTRGPKLTDSSNRYPHTCKLCGENFPKGRGEVLHKHITEKCPAITPEERINAALGFAGLHSAPSSQRAINLSNPLNDGLSAASDAPEAWSALRTLAEASRQVGAHELGPPQKDVSDMNGHHHHHQPEAHQANGFELQEQFTLENPPPSYEMNQQERKDDGSDPLNYLTTEEKLEHLQAVTQPSPSAPVDSSDLAGVVAAAATAAAATARLGHSLMDGELHDLPVQAPDSQMHDTHSEPTRQSSTEAQMPESHAEPHFAMPQMESQPPPPPPAPPAQQPWGEMSYVTNSPILPAPSRPPQVATPIRGGTRMSIGNGLRSEHKRKAYSPSRRKEVQAARKKGACIRCRILRKTCGLNDPCDQCRKIQGPRHWTYPCVRTHLSQALTLYSAGLIVVLAQNRVNQARSNFQLLQNGTKLRVSLWNDSVPMSLAAMVTPRQPPSEDGKEEQKSAAETHQVVMIDQNREDLPARMETYLAEMLPLLIDREPSHFIRVVLDFAQRAENKTGDLIKRSIDLWGLVEILDRERSWCIFEERQGELVPRGPEDVAATEQDIYNLMTWQLSAAAERKANAVSQKLISELQRCLENGKTSIHFDVYLAILILLHCLEKTTWTIKVWEMDAFRQRWPLERPPSAFTSQGHEIAELLKMLLTLRKAHPKTFRGADGRLAVSDPKDPTVGEFFEALNLHYDDVAHRLEHCAFSPESSRSLEFHFSGLVLLPQRDQDATSQDAASHKHETGSSFGQPATPQEQTA